MRLAGFRRRLFLALVASSMLLATACEPDRPPKPAARGAVIVEDTSRIVRPNEARHSVAPIGLNNVEVGNDDRLLTLRFPGGNSDCWSVEEVSVEYDPETIRLRVTGGYEKLPANTFCTMESVGYAIVVRLKESVAGRSIAAKGLGSFG